MECSDQPPAYSKVPQTEAEEAAVAPPRFVSLVAPFFVAWAVLSMALVHYTSEVDDIGLFLACAICIPVRHRGPVYLQTANLIFQLTILVNSCCYGGATVAISVEYPEANSGLVALVVPAIYTAFVLWMYKTCADQGTFLVVCFCGVPVSMGVFAVRPCAYMTSSGWELQLWC